MRFFSVLKFKILGAVKPGAFIYIVSNDNLFVNKISLKIVANSEHDIIHKPSGEELLKELTFNPPPDRVLPIVLLDYKLAARGQKELKNGIEILKEIKETYPDYIVAVIFNKDKSTLKTRALNAGADYSLTKNENAWVRILHFINTNINIYRVAIEKNITKKIFYVFISFLGITAIIFLINVIFQ